MNRFALALAAALLAVPTVAQAARHQISGEVQDRNGDPLDRAIISLDPGNVQLVTDREGRFLIDYLRDEDGERTRLDKKTDYTLEVFKPGYHVESLEFYYKRGPVELKPITLVEETIEIRDDGENLDPELYSERNSNVGATYEGQ